MSNNQSANKIFTKLKSVFEDESLNDFNLQSILKKSSITEEDFYYFFPNKTQSICNFFLNNLQSRLEKKIKKKIKKEKSISKRISFILFELMKILNQDKKVSLFFLNYISMKPIYLKKLTYKFSDRIWRILEDKSVDFNFYTKRLILAQILVNSILYWRGSNDIEKTKFFIEEQIFLLGKFGYYKSNIKKFICKVAPTNFFTKFDFLH